jgi:hypothetical protein
MLLVFSFSVLTPAWAQETRAQQFAPVVVRPLEFPMVGYPKSIDEFNNVPPDITLVPRGEGARHGQLWIRTVAQQGAYALYIAGKVDGGPPDFPLTRDLIPSKDHIEIWLAGSRDVDLPAIGWNQNVTLPKGTESCEDWVKNSEEQRGDLKQCQEWAESQVRYREYFKRLFVRQWLLAPREEMEVYATPAFEHIADWYSDQFDKVDEIMKPRGNLRLWFFPEPSGYSFQVFIDFPEFPPLPQLQTKELYLLVDVFSAAPAGKKTGVYATSSPARVWGKTSTFNALRLDPPFSFSMTACELPLGETAKEKEAGRTWFFPIIERNGSWSGSVYKTLPDVTTSFVIENNPGCHRWDPQGLSPWVRTTQHFSMGIGNGTWVCGPNLTIAKEGKSESFPYVIRDAESLDRKEMPDGHVLINVGPQSVENCCSGMPCSTITDLKNFDLGKDMKLRPALSLGSTVDGFQLVSQDFKISPDWSQVTEYDDHKGGVSTESDTWSSTTWCLKVKNQKDQTGGYIYEKCGEKENVQPPNPPVPKALRQGIN